MTILTGLLIAVEILVSILLILIILVQPSKGGGGLGGALGGGMSEQLFGARTGNILTKATIVFASIFMINTIALAMIYSRDDQLESAVNTSRAGIAAPAGMQAEEPIVTEPEVAETVETEAVAPAPAEAEPAAE